MKGLVFKELIEMVEDKFGEEMAEMIIEKSKLPSGGAYTSIGTYDHQEILDLVVSLSRESSIPIGDLVKTFGKYLATRFAKLYADFFKHDSAMDFLKTVDGIIHVEVKKLYPEAELPKFTYEEPNEKQLIMQYESSRPFALLAEGLILGFIEHFDEKINLKAEDTSDGKGVACTFTLTRE